MTNKIKVLYFIPELGTGGTERLIYDLCRLLDSESFTPSVCSFHSGSYEHKLREYGIKVHLLVGQDRLPASRSIFSKLRGFINRVSALDAILLSENINIINSHHLGSLFHLVFSRERRRRIWIHTEHIRPDIEYVGSQLLKCASWLYKRPDVVTGVSSEVVSYYTKELGVAPEKCRLVLNGVNVAAFSRTVEVVRKRQEVGLLDTDIVVGTMANLRPQKNHKNLIRAFAQARKKAPNLKLLLAGDGECRSDLEELACKLDVSNGILFLGHRTDAEELMAIIDIYCLPSFYEGMPLSIMEAWAAGKPVVATDVLGIREIVRDQENGLLVRSDDSSALADALLKMIQDDKLQQTIANNGRNLAHAECSIEQMVARYESIYRNLMVSES